jgi:hypothetical protein
VSAISSHSPDRGRLAALCEVYAQQILDARGEEPLVRRAILAAEAAVRREMPLTRPPDAELLVLIEEAVVRLRDSPPKKDGPPRSRDALVGAILDASKVKTHGDLPVEDPDDDVPESPNLER